MEVLAGARVGGLVQPWRTETQKEVFHPPPPESWDPVPYLSLDIREDHSLVS